MSKDARLMVRMSPELRAWVHEQALGREQDDAAFVRMVLSELRRVGAPPIFSAPASPAPRPDYSAQELIVDRPADSHVEEDPGTRADDEAVATVDVDALVAQGLEQAQQQGLTQPQPRIEPEHVTLGGVRAVNRPPIRYSPKAQPSWIPQQ